MRLPELVRQHSGLSQSALARYEKTLKKEVLRMRQASKEKYSDERASINLCLDTEHVKMCEGLARKYSDASLLIIVGIGGSNLGTLAIQEALTGKLHNLHRSPRVLYVDTVDPDVTTTVNTILTKTLQDGKEAVLFVVSKSGGTTETIANFEVLVRTMQKHVRKDKSRIVICSDENSKLWSFAVARGFEVLPIPEKVGGRYSVFSPVGLFPLALLGVNVKKLLSGAREMRRAGLQKRGNPAIFRAAALAHALNNGRNIANNFYFKSDFEGIGKWYRQLMAESIGKEWDHQHKKRVFSGMTPTVSVGTTDLHSMAQLYFGGPSDTFHTVVTVKSWKTDVDTPRDSSYDVLVQHIQGKHFSTIMDAVVEGVESVLRKQKRPFMSIRLADSSPESIGALLQLHMMEIMYLGALLGVNPFDQPNVESYKDVTRKILR